MFLMTHSIFRVMGLEDVAELKMVIKYDFKQANYKISGDIKEEKYKDVLEAFLHMQIGAGEDKSPVRRKNVYTIVIGWQPADDTFTCEYDTGNKSLRDGLLIDVLNRLD